MSHGGGGGEVLKKCHVLFEWILMEENQLFNGYTIISQGRLNMESVGVEMITRRIFLSFY